ncbi:hypothetical protein HNY73_002274 [Argiope bruennichi]|uniref:Uncharacterized protein n=1 Tax=Argiope bruennichi TaxID=94029 RepID=A0A8T0FSZ4_ARGBR|nr:hypothetical protein HNY73_002274 [Argiope bruennichi]
MGQEDPSPTRQTSPLLTFCASNSITITSLAGKKPEEAAGDGSLVDKAIPGYADQQPSGPKTDLVDSVGLMGRVGQRQTEC